MRYSKKTSYGMDSIRNNIMVVRRKKVMYIVLTVLTVLTLFIAVYFLLMPINLSNAGFKFFIVLVPLIWSFPIFAREEGEKAKTYFRRVKKNLFSKKGIAGLIAAALILLILLMNFFTSPLFLAKKYRGLITVADNGGFKENVENYTEMQIPVVDRALAKKLGDKKMGEGNKGSQFEVDDYTMITYCGSLYWVAPVEYRGFFQWANRPATPGYVKIKATDPSDVQIVEQPLKYVDSSYLWDDLKRKMYFSGSDMFTYREQSPHLELDDEGKPMFIDSVLRKNFAFTNGVDTIGVIVTDAVDGKSVYYDVEDAPPWIDIVQSESIVYNQLNYWGKYVNGFFNSLFAKKEVLMASEGYNYIYNKGKMYLYTGVTSVGNDESIVGVVFVDLRNKSSFLYKVTGATESAAALSAIGAEQAQRFGSSFPILINVNGEPTYFMTLKDDEGLIKRYAYVNVKDYTLVSVNADRETALSNYITKVNPEKEIKESELFIRDISRVIVNGETVYLLKLSNTMDEDAADFDAALAAKIFKAPLSLNYELAFMRKGDRVTVSYVDGGENLIQMIRRS